LIFTSSKRTLLPYLRDTLLTEIINFEKFEPQNYRMNHSKRSYYAFENEEFD